MSGASGKIPAAIHCTPEAAHGGPIAKIRDGDLLRLDAVTGTLEALVDLTDRIPGDHTVSDEEWTGTGRELFAALRRAVGPADAGASVFGPRFEQEPVVEDGLELTA
jgi:phosphogluconate dehydratase